MVRSDVNGRPQYRDVYTGVGLHTRAVGAVRKDDLGFAASLDACEPRPHAAPQERTDKHRMAHVGSTTPWVTQRDLNTEAELSCRERDEHQQSEQNVAATTS